jgi:hypothetical protein
VTLKSAEEEELGHKEYKGSKARKFEEQCSQHGGRELRKRVGNVRPKQ